MSLKQEYAAEIKEVGLNIAEEDAIKLLKLHFKFAKKALPANLAVLAPIVDVIEAELLKLADKIDGQEG